MHSLLFAALETFSIVLLRKKKKKKEKNIQKGGIPFFRLPPVWVCKPCCSSCHSLFDLWPVLLAAYIFIFWGGSVRHMKDFSWAPTTRVLCLPTRAFRYPDVLQIVVLNLLLIFSRGKIGKVIHLLFFGERERDKERERFLYSKVAFYDIIPSVLCNVEGSISRGESRTGRAAEAPWPSSDPRVLWDLPLSRGAHLVLTEPSVITSNPRRGLAERARPLAAPSPSDRWQRQMASGEAAQAGSPSFLRGACLICHCDVFPFGVHSLRLRPRNV